MSSSQTNWAQDTRSHTHSKVQGYQRRYMSYDIIRTVRLPDYRRRDPLSIKPGKATPPSQIARTPAALLTILRGHTHTLTQ